jgi:hypothetical protein
LLNNNKNGPDAKPEWKVSGTWKFTNLSSNSPTFNASFDMMKLDGSSKHKHTIDATITSADFNRAEKSPRYTQAVNQYQEQTIQIAREVADNFLESQKEIVNSIQSPWVPPIEKAYGAFWNYWTSPTRLTDIYARAVSSFADNTIAATKLVNNNIFSNLDAFRICAQNTRDNLKEVSRINVNAAKAYEQTSRDASTATARSVGF